MEKKGSSSQRSLGTTGKMMAGTREMQGIPVLDHRQIAPPSGLHTPGLSDVGSDPEVPSQLRSSASAVSRQQKHPEEAWEPSADGETVSADGQLSSHNTTL